MIALLLCAAALAGQDLNLKAADGSAVHAVAEKAPDSARGVVLVHMLGRDAGDWVSLSARLVKAGMTTVAPDLRGHGRSARAGQELADADYPAMAHDVRAAVAWLRAQGVTEISCVGASIGANLCLSVAAEDPQLVNVVMLSPGLNYKGVVSPPALKAYGNRPLLLVASEEDAPAAHASTLLSERALGQVYYELYNGAGHGTRMLNREAALEGLVQSWLLGTFELGNGEVVVPRPAMQVDSSEIATEGKRLQSHE